MIRNVTAYKKCKNNARSVRNSWFISYINSRNHLKQANSRYHYQQKQPFKINR